MRISDWSSDVCSSDLNRAQYRARASVINLRKTRVGAAVSAANAVILLHEGDVEASTITTWMRLIAPLDRPITVAVCIGGRDRKSGVQGKSVYVRDVLGGRRTMKKKK